MTPIDDLLDQLQRDIPLYGHLMASIGFKQALVERLAHPALRDLMPPAVRTPLAVTNVPRGGNRVSSLRAMVHDSQPEPNSSAPAKRQRA